MANPETKRIVSEKLKKYHLTPSEIMVSYAAILLISLVVGFIYQQFLGENVIWQLAAGCSLIYLFWLFWQGRKATKEALGDIMALAIENLDKK